MKGRLPPRQAPRIGVLNLFDESGTPIRVLPDYVDADFMRSTFRKGGKSIVVDAEGLNVRFDEGLVRAQIPYLVTVFVYHSKFQMLPVEQEWLLYAPGDLKSAATSALMMWKRWFKPSRKPGEAAVADIREDYPLLRDGVVVEPIDDAFYDECWRYVCKRPHKCAGHPEKPHLFTCLEADFKIYKHTDRQQGLIHRIR